MRKLIMTLALGLCFVSNQAIAKETNYSTAFDVLKGINMTASESNFGAKKYINATGDINKATITQDDNGKIKNIMYSFDMNVPLVAVNKAGYRGKAIMGMIVSDENKKKFEKWYNDCADSGYNEPFSIENFDFECKILDGHTFSFTARKQ